MQGRRVVVYKCFMEEVELPTGGLRHHLSSIAKCVEVGIWDPSKVPEELLQRRVLVDEKVAKEVFGIELKSSEYLRIVITE